MKTFKEFIAEMNSVVGFVPRTSDSTFFTDRARVVASIDEGRGPIFHISGIPSEISVDRRNEGLGSALAAAAAELGLNATAAPPKARPAARWRVERAAAAIQARAGLRHRTCRRSPARPTRRSGAADKVAYSRMLSRISRQLKGPGHHKIVK